MRRLPAPWGLVLGLALWTGLTAWTGLVGLSNPIPTPGREMVESARDPVPDLVTAGAQATVGSMVAAGWLGLSAVRRGATFLARAAAVLVVCVVPQAVVAVILGLAAAANDRPRSGAASWSASAAQQTGLVVALGLAAFAAGVLADRLLRRRASALVALVPAAIVGGALALTGLTVLDDPLSLPPAEWLVAWVGAPHELLPSDPSFYEVSERETWLYDVEASPAVGGLLTVSVVVLVVAVAWVVDLAVREPVADDGGGPAPA